MAARGNNVIGIRREDKNKWERRVPLTPAHVAQLVRRGVTVLVQPSHIRVFPNQAYLEAGAVLCEDLTPAGTILAVKEVPIHLLLPGKTYLFFSHTIKAQPANMPLLDALLHAGIRLIDYECITVAGMRGAKRLVAFGRYAGVAGMVDYLRGLGERFLSMGYSTPFLGVAAMYTYPTLAAAMDAVRVCGAAIARYGLPADLCPLTVVFTGDGNVSRGAQEVFGLLPVTWVEPTQLESIVRTSAGSARTHVVYGAVAVEKHMARLRVGAQPTSPLLTSMNDTPSSPTWRIDVPAEVEAPPLAVDEAFDKADYKLRPEAYEPIFHDIVLPYTSILVNCMYWEARFPRLVTVKQAAALHAARRLRLLGVCDITCDFQGSVEFLKEFTSIEKPFYIYDIEHDKVMHDLEAPGILYHAVDHLPSECPQDASEHFGNCLLPFLPAIAASDDSRAFAEQDDLPPEIKGAVVTHAGQLTPNFDYIIALRAAADRANANRVLRARRQESFATVELVGHLFDTGIINKILDTIEHSSASAHIIDFHVGKDRSTPTELRLQVFASGGGTMESLTPVLEEIVRLAASMGVRVSAGGEGSYMHDSVAAKTVPRSVTVPAKRILLLGSGFVSGPVVEYLLRRVSNQVTVASMIKAEAEALAPGHARVHVVQLDVFKDTDKLRSMVGAHDIVISLVPAPCHPGIARMAIDAGKHMVTASYVSPDMRALHDDASRAGVTILNEAGLDPGIDHMSAMKLIDDARAAGGVITRFSSVCGGLPAPEAANNPLGYKFSWSPRGALVAMRNTAKYMHDGHVIDVPGDALLATAQPFRVNPAFCLECLPNRDSLPYAEKYGIAGPQLRGMFRGTLRYAGFAASMHTLAALGFTGVDLASVPRGVTLRELLALAVNMTSASASDDDLFDAVVSRAAASAEAAITAYIASVASVSASTAAAAKATATVSSNMALQGGAFRRGELRKFLEWAGFFSPMLAPLRGGDAGDGITNPKLEEVIAAERAAGAQSAVTNITHVPIDTLVALLTGKAEMAFGPGERDMALMQHEVEVTYADGSRKQHTSTLIEYAKDGRTAMARTVGLTTAIGAQLILDGAVPNVSGHGHGVCVPVTRDWYAPILDALAEEGIAMTETSKVLAPAKIV